ncbi:MAG TPA: aminopeptidase P family N-terminal domain-containing protein, partial [Verrucomicrobiae bacterium]|nr:aminopeptidase P family N-terminal domain-containing protein [Verrucomicrobiae bacterium]
MTNLDRLRYAVLAMDVQGFLIPSSDEYLSEYAQPNNRRLRWATNFTGSTGALAVTRDRSALIVDGRYTEHGARDTAGLALDIVDVAPDTQLAWYAANLRRGDRFAVDGRLHPYAEVQSIIALLGKIGVEVVDAPTNPVDLLWTDDRPSPPVERVQDYPVIFAGNSREAKFVALAEHLKRTGADWHVLADPEDVAWLLNMRIDMSVEGAHRVPIPLCRAVASVAGHVNLFIDDRWLDAALAEQLRGLVTVHAPDGLESFLGEVTPQRIVSANLRKTPYRVVSVVTGGGGAIIDDQIVALERWKKHPNEIEASRQAHRKDGAVVIRLLSWLQQAVKDGPVMELDAAYKIRRLRREFNDFRGESMPELSASGPSGALAHYVPSEKTNRRINDHPIYWLDSGGHYPGTTDNTVCFSVGTPEAKHVRAHTL